MDRTKRNRYLWLLIALSFVPGACTRDQQDGFTAQEPEHRRKSDEKTSHCLEALRMRAIEDIRQGLFVESDLYHLFRALSSPQRACHRKSNARDLDILGAVELEKGVILRQGTPQVFGDLWVWTLDRLFRMNPQKIWFEHDQPLSVPPQALQEAVDKVLLSWGPAIARAMNDRSHRLYQRRRYGDAKEVIQYALNLDPKYNLAWYNASAYAALAGEGFEAIRFLEKVSLPGPKLLAKVRADPDFRSLMESSRDFRQFLYWRAVEAETASPFLRSFSVKAHYECLKPCGEADACEGCQEFQEGLLLLQNAGTDKERRLVLWGENVGEQPWVRMADIGERLFLAFRGKGYEADWSKQEFRLLGPADLLFAPHDRFPLILARRVSAQETTEVWEISTYSGEPNDNVSSQGCYRLTSPLTKERFDPFWRFSRVNETFQAQDMVGGKTYPLTLIQPCPATDATKNEQN